MPSAVATPRRVARFLLLAAALVAAHPASAQLRRLSPGASLDATSSWLAASIVPANEQPKPRPDATSSLTMRFKMDKTCGAWVTKVQRFTPTDSAMTKSLFLLQTVEARVVPGGATVLVVERIPGTTPVENYDAEDKELPRTQGVRVMIARDAAIATKVAEALNHASELCTAAEKAGK